MVVHINIYVCTERKIVLPYMTESLRLNSETAEHLTVLPSTYPLKLKKK